LKTYVNPVVLKYILKQTGDRAIRRHAGFMTSADLSWKHVWNNIMPAMMIVASMRCKY